MFISPFIVYIAFNNSFTILHIFLYLFPNKTHILAA